MLLRGNHRFGKLTLRVGCLCESEHGADIGGLLVWVHLPVLPNERSLIAILNPLVQGLIFEYLLLA